MFDNISTMKDASARYRALPVDEEKSDFTSAHPADSASNDVLPSAQKMLPHMASRRRQNFSKVFPWLIHILLFVFSVCTGVLVSRTSEEICQPEKTGEQSESFCRQESSVSQIRCAPWYAPKAD
jgi:hypothetical protein